MHKYDEIISLFSQKWQELCNTCMHTKARNIINTTLHFITNTFMYVLCNIW